MKKIVLIALLLVMSAQAELWKSKPLLAIEGGFAPNVGIDYKASPTASELTNYTQGPTLGLKIGAEGDEFRVFIGGRYMSLDNFKYAFSGGLEFQYLIRIAKAFNIFAGVEAGYMSMKFNDADFGATSGIIRVIETPYYGGDIGINIDFGESFGIELGGRLLQLNSATNINPNPTTSLDSTTRLDYIPSVYGSLIFKFLPN